jgi:hypothetical protein
LFGLKLFVLHARALGERLEPVARHGPQTVGVVLAADFVQQAAPRQLVHALRTNFEMREFWADADDVGEKVPEPVLGVRGALVVGARDGGELALGHESRGHAR